MHQIGLVKSMNRSQNDDGDDVWRVAIQFNGKKVQFSLYLSYKDDRKMSILK